MFRGLLSKAWKERREASLHHERPSSFSRLAPSGRGRFFRSFGHILLPICDRGARFILHFSNIIVYILSRDNLAVASIAPIISPHGIPVRSGNMCALGLAVRAIHARVVGRGCLPARACQQDEREPDEARFILKSASGLATVQSTVGRLSV